MLCIFIGIALLVVTGISYRKMTLDNKHQARYERRNRIVEWSWDLANRMNRWEADHSKHTYKGGSNTMTSSEFVEALHQ